MFERIALGIRILINSQKYCIGESGIGDLEAKWWIFILIN